MRGANVNGVRLRQIRHAHRMTQQELANRAGVAVRTVRNAEIGKRIRLEFLEFIAIALGVRLAEIVNDHDELNTGLEEQQRVERIFAAIAAHVQGDQREIFQLASQNIVLRSPGHEAIPFTGEFRGVDGLKSFFERSAAAISYDEAPQITEIRTGGNLVVVSGTDRIIANPTGTIHFGHWTHVYEFEKGRIVRLDNYGFHYDLEAAFKSMRRRSR